MGIHAYYPRKREAYGHRDGQRYRYVEDRLAIPAANLLGMGIAGPRLVAQPLPCGGQRWYALCYACGHRCQKIYDEGGLWLCRRCAGLTYWSQYEGRRPAADCRGLPERALWAMYQGHRGWYDALLTWLEREAQHDARAWASMAISQGRWERYLKRCDAMERGECAPKPTPQERAAILDLRQRWQELSQKRKRAA